MIWPVADHFGGDEAWAAGRRDDDPRALHDLLERRDLDAGVARSLVRRLHGVGGDDGFGAGLADEVRDAESGGSKPELSHHGIGEVDAGLRAGDVDRAQGCDGRPVDVVVHDGDVELGDEPRLDLEAVGRADVLEVNATEAAGDALHRFDERVGVFGVDEDRHSRDAGELAIEHGLALHDGHRRDGPDVAEAENARAVGADGDGAPDHGEAVGERRVVGNGEADAGDAGGVDVAHVLEGAHLVAADDVQLAALVRVEGAIPERDDAHAFHLTELGGDALCLFVIAYFDGDLADRALAADRDGVNVADEAVLLRDAGAYLRELPSDVGLLEPVHVVDGHCRAD